MGYSLSNNKGKLSVPTTLNRCPRVANRPYYLTTWIPAGLIFESTKGVLDKGAQLSKWTLFPSSFNL